MDGMWSSDSRRSQLHSPADDQGLMRISKLLDGRLRVSCLR